MCSGQFQIDEVVLTENEDNIDVDGDMGKHVEANIVANDTTKRVEEIISPAVYVFSPCDDAI